MLIRTLIAPAAFAALLTAACSDSPKEQARVQDAAQREALRATIRELKGTSKADGSWYAALNQRSGKNLAPIYSVDLERLWLIGKPILFLGALEDVTTHSDSEYRLKVTEIDYDYIGRGVKLRIDLLCPKPKVDPVLARIRSDQSNLTPGGVAVAANLSRLSSISSGAETLPAITGHGSCVDLVYTGDRRFGRIGTEKE